MAGLPLGERQLNTLDAQLQGQRSGKTGILLPAHKPNNAAQQQIQPSRSAGPAAKAAAPPAEHMEEAELSQMLDLCLRLAAENRITDKNVWALPLIDHLPDIVQTAAKGAAVNFGKMSSGLDAGVQIYSKRVEQTWKAAHNSLFGIDKKDSSKDGDEGDGGDAEDDEEGEDGEGGGASAAQREAKAAAAAARRAKAHAAEGQASDTLEAPEKLAMKALDTTFQIDPLFHHMSAKFDQGGAAGLLQLHCRVYGGSALLTEPHASPEACFCGPPVADQLVEVGATAGRLRALAGQAAAGTLDTRVTPDIQQLAGLLGVPMGEGVEAAAKALVQGVADEVFESGKAFPSVASATAAAAAGGGEGGADGISTQASGGSLLGLQDQDSPMEDAAYSSSSPGAPQQQEEGQEAAAAAGAGGQEGPDPVLAAFAAACVTQEDLEEVAGGGRTGGEFMGGDYDDGYDGDGGGGWEEEEGGEAGAGGHHVARSAAGGLLRVAPLAAGGSSTQVAGSLDPLAWLRNLEGSCTSSSGWAVAGSWKRGGGAKGARAAAKRPRVAKQEAARLDFCDPPQLPEGAFDKGTKQQTCLAGSGAAAATLRPKLARYEASSFAHLFCNPGATAAHYIPAGGWGQGPAAGSRPGPYSTPGKREYTTELDMEAAADVADGDMGAGWCGGWDDGGDDDGGGGWDGGDGSSLDGPAAAAGAGMAPWQMGGDAQRRRRGSVGGWGVEEDDEEGGGYQLLRVAHKVEAVGINYCRSAKQVDVRALKDVIWDKLNTVAEVAQQQEAAAEEEEMEGSMIHFQQVLREVPAVSAAGPLEELSVHMCFICLLHLANEKGLAIASTEDLAGLKIRGDWN